MGIKLKELKLKLRFFLSLLFSICSIVCNANASDKKEGRFFSDQPDVNDDFQIHFNYMVTLDGEDREWDINGKLEKLLM